nr:ATP-dependent DNA helicase PIF2 [Tanacetum cinerariifolium]
MALWIHGTILDRPTVTSYGGIRRTSEWYFYDVHSDDGNPFRANIKQALEQPRVHASRKIPKRAALTSAGVHVSYHNLGPPSYQCRNCNAYMGVTHAEGLGKEWFYQGALQEARGTRIFQMKLTKLLDDLTKREIFGKSRAVVYVIEFQKRGLPHAHILLWLEEECKCTNLTQIDDIISAEIPCLTDDPEGYKVVTEFILLNDDKEWAHAISEASLWALGPQIRDLFVTMLLFCDVSRPLQLWEQSWQILSEDILNKKRKLFKYPDLQLTDEHLKNYCLLEIEALFNRNGRSLTDFLDLPRPDPTLLTHIDNRLIREALDYDIKKIKLEHTQLHLLLNLEQHVIYEQVVESVHNKNRQFYFVYGPGRTGKTFLYKTIILSIRVNRYYTTGEIDTRKQQFNKWVLDVGDGNLPAKIEKEDEETWIEIPEEFIISSVKYPIEEIVKETFLDFATKKSEEAYLKERAILTPRNDNADAINAYMFENLPGQTVTYNSADEVCKASTDTLEQQHLYLVESLNSLNFSRMPPYALHLKKELPVMLLRNVNLSQGLCNETLLIITNYSILLFKHRSLLDQM